MAQPTAFLRELPDAHAETCIALCVYGTDHALLIGYDVVQGGAERVLSALLAQSVT